LTSCSPNTIVLKQSAVQKVEGGWLVPDATMADLLECCDACVSSMEKEKP